MVRIYLGFDVFPNQHASLFSFVTLMERRAA